VLAQLNNSGPLVINIKPAVTPWTPKAAAFVPPCLRTIDMSVRGMTIAMSINQPSNRADWLRIRIAVNKPGAISRIAFTERPVVRDEPAQRRSIGVRKSL
jgi:hypothetical protein